MSFWAIAITVGAAYLLGSVPNGYLAGRLKGVDIRALGSGNIGATNVFRNLGTTVGILVLLLDAAKGYAASRYAVHLAFRLTESSLSDPVLGMMLGGFAAILGHNYPLWLRFKGGKGIATSAGVLAALMPGALGCAVAGFVVALALSRFVSLGSIVAAIVLPFAAVATGSDRRLALLAASMSALALYRHRSNIRRILAGTEPRLGTTKPTSAGEAA